MTISEKRLLANRRNAQRSTGPKTRRGKLVSRNNALRHGLARRIANDRAFSLRLEELTALLARGSNDAWYRELARRVAECLLELQRIRGVRSQILLSLGELETADLCEHERTVAQLQKIERYERSVISRRSMTVQAFYSASATALEEPSVELDPPISNEEG